MAYNLTRKYRCGTAKTLLSKKFIVSQSKREIFVVWRYLSPREQAELLAQGFELFDEMSAAMILAQLYSLETPRPIRTAYKQDE